MIATSIVARTRPRGFTLIEVLVAVLIFALLAAAAYAALDALLRARTGLHARAVDLRQWQTTIGRLERDLRQASDRGVRNEYGEPVAMLRGDATGIELTRAGLANPLEQARARIERVQWAVTDHRLHRMNFAVLDRAVASRPLITPMLDAVTRVEFSYFDGAQWRNQWPRPNVAPGTAAGLPRAIAVVLETRGFGELRRVIELSEAAPAAAPGTAP